MADPDETAADPDETRVDPDETRVDPDEEGRARTRRPIRVLVVDDHPMVRRGLRSFLESQDDMEVVGEAADGAAMVDAVAACSPDVVLLDLVMPGTDGVAGLELLRERQGAEGGAEADAAVLRRPHVLVVTSYTDQRGVVPAIRAGAGGYVYKDVDPRALAAAVRSVHAGHVLLEPEVAAALLSAPAENPDTGRGPGPDGVAGPPLTVREREVLRLVARGKSNREISRALVLSEKTVKTHMSNILLKLGLADRTQAALYAVRHGLDG